MKKAKLMLVAVAIFTIAGSALAFKARSLGNLFCTAVTGAIPPTTAKFLTTLAGQQRFCTTTTGVPATTTTIVVRND